MWRRHIEQSKSLAYVLDAAAAAAAAAATAAQHGVQDDAEARRSAAAEGSAVLEKAACDQERRLYDAHASGIAENLVQQWRHLRAELSQYDSRLLETPCIVVINKVDVLQEAEKHMVFDAVSSRLAAASDTGLPVVLASALKGTGIRDVQTSLQQMLASAAFESVGDSAFEHRQGQDAG